MNLSRTVHRLANGIVRRAVGSAGRLMLRSRGADLARHSVILAEATYSPWLSDQPFQEVYSAVRDNTLVGVQRCYELWHLVGQVKHLTGDIIEVGVWRGGTGALLAMRSQLEGLGATTYLCDTFRGVVKAGPRDNSYTGGEHSDVDRAGVDRLIASLHLKDVEILAGVFPEETAHLIPADRRFRLCHVDVDVYRSARDVLDWVWPRLVVGGMVVFDDYGFPECEGVTTLVNDEAKKPDRIMIQNLNGHGILIKVPEMDGPNGPTAGR
jgi:O-methyltransferase